MKLENNIGWCDATGNMVIGCTPADATCRGCYAEMETPARVLRAGAWPGMAGRKVETWGEAGERVPVGTLEKLLPWANQRLICDRCHGVVRRGNGAGVADIREGTHCACSAKGGVLRRIRVFGDSSSDWLDRKWPVERRVKLLQLAYENPNVNLLLLTKRIGWWHEAVAESLDWVRRNTECKTVFEPWLCDWLHSHLPPGNIWLGVSCGVKSALPRLDQLRGIPAAVRFVSFEPLIEDVFAEGVNLRGIDWAIFGGESGSLRAKDPKRRPRPCHVRWIQSGERAARTQGLKVYVKQMGSLAVSRNDAGFDGESPSEWPMGTETVDDIEPETEYQGKPVRVRLKHPDGADPAEWPEPLRVREWPDELPW